MNDDVRLGILVGVILSIGLVVVAALLTGKLALLILLLIPAFLIWLGGRD